MSDEVAFDLTPDPKVLIALTRTPLSPLDALCELIDNSIDGFRAATIQGVPVKNPIIAISLPSKADVRDGIGVLQIRDNGPGMSATSAEQSVRAGFSGNNPYDSLGLFGMGFNIATGKLGRVTHLHTCRIDETVATEVTIDLDQIRQKRSFRVPYSQVAKSEGFAHGTLLKISVWWPLGDANHGFIGKLIQYGLPSIRREIGRRYAAILRRKGVRISINDSECEAFEHCVWAKERFVERRTHGQIPAQIEFDEVIGNQRRCAACTAVVGGDESACPVCASEAIRTVQERIKGWVGIQRYDSLTNFGIDLIRNGRLIRLGERTAFFEFEDELKRVTKDYPIDQTFGRIVGEVHLDHVPVDFLKQDFQRSSPEWVRAIEFLRGTSSLQPQMEGAKDNRSPVFTLYQGYRKVRTPGRTDMYMGHWDVDEGRQKRITRAKEEELLALFEKRLPGYFDDTEWWRLVEQADSPPPLELRDCQMCHAQNPMEAELCQICGHVLRGHPCINPTCSQVVALSVEACPACGTRQFPEEQVAWACGVCARKNSATTEECAGCGAPRGAVDPLGESALRADSTMEEGLSHRGFSIRLPDGSPTQPLDLQVYRVVRPMTPFGVTERAVMVKVPSLTEFRAYVDFGHYLFKAYRVQVELVVAQALAEHILATNPRSTDPQYGQLYSNAWVTAQILRTLIGKPENPEEQLRQEADDLIASVRERLITAFDGAYADLSSNMPVDEAQDLVAALIAANAEIGRYGEMLLDGSFLGYVGARTLVRAITDFPTLVFDGRVWKAPYAKLAELPESVATQQQQQTRRRFINCLEDVIEQRDRPDADSAIRDRALASLRFLRGQLA